MILELKEYTMASLGYKSSENPLISPNQTHPYLPQYKSCCPFLLQPFDLLPSFFFFVLLLLFFSFLLRPCAFAGHPGADGDGDGKAVLSHFSPQPHPKPFLFSFPLVFFPSPSHQQRRRSFFPAIHGGPTTGRGKAPSFLGFLELYFVLVLISYIFPSFFVSFRVYHC